MDIKSFLHVKLDVADLERSLEFYYGILGFKKLVRYELNNGGVIEQVSPNGLPPAIELWYEPPFKGLKNDRLHIALEVEDVFSTIKRLEDKGVLIERKPFRIGHEIIAFIRDPDGYIIEINGNDPSNIIGERLDGGPRKTNRKDI